MGRDVRAASPPGRRFGSAPKPILLALTLAALTLLLMLATHRLWLAALGGYLVAAEAPAPADILVVLAGDLTGGRLLTAAGLARRGFAPKVLVSGPGDLFGRHECDFAIPFAVARGYPEAYFAAFPNEAKSTGEEARDVIPALRKMGARRVEIVTSSFHTRRAGGIYRKQAPDLEFRMVGSPDPYFTPGGWWKNREGRKTFLVEWMKTVANWMGM